MAGKVIAKRAITVHYPSTVWLARNRAKRKPAAVARKAAVAIEQEIRFFFIIGPIG